MLAALLNGKGQGRERSRITFGVIDTVRVLLQHCGDATWKRDDIFSFVLAGADYEFSERAGAGAAKLAFTLCVSCGAETMRPTVEALGPSSQAAIMRALAETDIEHWKASKQDIPDETAAVFGTGNGVYSSCSAQGAGVEQRQLSREALNARLLRSSIGAAGEFTANQLVVCM